MISLEKHTERTRLLKLIRIHCKNSFPSQAQQVWREYTIFPYRRYRIPVVKTNCNMSANREQLQLHAPCQAGRDFGRQGRAVGGALPSSEHPQHCTLLAPRCISASIAKRYLKREKKHNSHEQPGGTAPGSVPLGNLTQKH